MPRCISRWSPSARAIASAWSPSATAPTTSCARAAAWIISASAAKTIYNLRAERVSPDFREVFTSLQLNLRRRSLLVFFTSLDDALLAETFEREVPILARRHLVLVNVTASDAGCSRCSPAIRQRISTTLYHGLAGQMLWNRMRKAPDSPSTARRQALALSSPARIKTQVTAAVSRCEAEAGAVIIDLPRFVAAERPYWEELEAHTAATRRRART